MGWHIIDQGAVPSMNGCYTWENSKSSFLSDDPESLVCYSKGKSNNRKDGPCLVYTAGDEFYYLTGRGRNADLEIQIKEDGEILFNKH